ncbi:RagB/SusD family nutrient uptake outer membrane protein [Ilyomonas limi]|uniref:RagB/SusD family nutrient uptake outer membrane protein n=1 Tax=Ilyomonas limi TaxID=2575867 RepID=A0A4V5UTN7_9BACT|nr:RagB/SusD family nutrient uptake outer membrane protein [Ilyomonas limi]TKK65833.1 RagB/SusD family nutrient uptake outer membrane protein [Ilyomonas limi]
MKKITIIYILFLPIAVSISSCKKGFLDRTPTDRLSTAIFWQKESDADLALTGLYNYLYAPGGGYATSQFTIMSWDNFSDDAYGQYDYGGGTSALTGGITPQSGGFVYSYYANSYQAIAAINSFLANVGKVLTGDKLTQYKAEAYFLRGFYYEWLAQLYGNVPITLEDPFLIDFKSTQGKSSKAEVLKQVESDLDSAIAGLPDEPYTTGHAVKGTAQGYKLRTLLLEEKWAEAAALAKEIIDGGKFSLNPNYAGNFYKPDQNASPEIMFSVKYQLPNVQHQDVALAVHLQKWKGELGTQDLINEYEPGDPRKTMTFFFIGDTQAQGWPFTGDLAVATPGKDSWIDGYYAVKKWLTPGMVNPDYGALDDNDFVLLRYADVKLMYAEAQNEAVGPDAGVYQQVNEVRARPDVNMPPLPAGLSQAEMRERIRHERRVEFALEGLRYHDLRRWGIATEKLNGFVPNPLFPNIKTKYEDKYQFWPIPQTEIDRNQPDLEQNPGY